MGNKNSSSHLKNHRNKSFTYQRKSNNYITDNDHTNAKFDTTSLHQGKKNGPSPRFRRRHTRQVHLDKKTKKLQTVSSYLNGSLQSIGDRTISLFSRSFNFLHPSLSSSPICLVENSPPESTIKDENYHPELNVGSHSGVYRNQSRRKLQTSSLRNPYRRSSTNFPVHGHEALFLPEFSIKGKITEADFEVIDIIARGAFGNVIQVCSIHDNQIYAMKIMSKSQIVKDNAVQQVKDIAPEVLSVRSYDHRVDWWSLGILMYACLFGEYPVAATKDHVTMANKVLNHSFNLPSMALDNKIQVKELLLKLLEKNPNQRLCSLDELRETSFMSQLDFNHVYAKYYSPLELLMNAKSQWRNEIGLHYNHRKKDYGNGKYSSSSSEEKTIYQNVDNRLFQKFSE
ncbi:unnamed protein product [Rotaria socialis]|uniref:Protein kinase domain-containing protein n=1 Tax=Rotaria socialis TaxID=392032 RepID=A0A821H7K7_9BILA|nr:unnamed protein product [Rotaria socialis]